MQQEKITPYHWLLFAICFFATAFAGTISTLMSVYLPVAVKDLLGDKNETELNRISAYINSVFIIGGAVGGFLCGFISDRLGRKPATILAIAACGIFTTLTGFMPNWWTVVICRFMSGFGLGGILVTTTMIMMEEWPKKSRAIFVGILSISIPVGIFSAGLIDYFVSAWREAFIIGIFPATIGLISLWILRESQSWLDNKANKFSIVKPVPDSAFSSAHRSRLITGSIIFGTMLIGLWAIFSWLPTWVQTFIVSGDGQKERGISMMMLGIGGLAGGFLSGWLMNAIGTRRAMLWCFIISAVFSFILFKTNSTFSPIVYGEVLVLALFFGASQGVLSVYIPQLFPVAVRGTATGFCFNIGRIFTAIAVLFVGILVEELGGYGNALFIFSAVFIIGLVATLLTKEKSLSETVVIPGNA